MSIARREVGDGGEGGGSVQWPSSTVGFANRGSGIRPSSKQGLAEAASTVRPTSRGGGRRVVGPVVEEGGDPAPLLGVGGAAEAEQEGEPDAGAFVVGLAAEPVGQGLGPLLDEGAVHQVEGLERDVGRLAVAGDEARLGEVEQVEHVGQAVADDRQVDRAVVRAVEVGAAGACPGRSARSACRGSPSATSEPSGRARSSSPEAASIASRIASGVEPTLGGTARGAGSRDRRGTRPRR